MGPIFFPDLPTCIVSPKKKVEKKTNVKTIYIYISINELLLSLIYESCHCLALSVISLERVTRAFGTWLKWFWLLKNEHTKSRIDDLLLWGCCWWRCRYNTIPLECLCRRLVWSSHFFLTPVTTLGLDCLMLSYWFGPQLSGPLCLWQCFDLNLIWEHFIIWWEHFPTCSELCNIAKINDFITLLIIFTMHRQEDRSQTWNENT